MTYPTENTFETTLKTVLIKTYTIINNRNNIKVKPYDFYCWYFDGVNSLFAVCSLCIATLWSDPFSWAEAYTEPSWFRPRFSGSLSTMLTPGHTVVSVTGKRYWLITSLDHCWRIWKLRWQLGIWKAKTSSSCSLRFHGITVAWINLLKNERSLNSLREVHKILLIITYFEDVSECWQRFFDEKHALKYPVFAIAFIFKNICMIL